MKQRTLFIDFAKAIAIVLMVLLHSNYTYPAFNAGVGSFHMAVFFFVAGLFAKGKNTPVRDVAIRSFNQLLIPYFIFSIIGLTYGWVFPYLHPADYHADKGFGDIFKKAIIGILLMRDRVTAYAFHPCAALWFLSSLFWCRVLFSIWIHSKPKYLYLSRIIIVGALAFCNVRHISVFAMDSTAVSIPYFILGYYVNRWVIRDFKNVNVFYFVFLAIFALIAVYLLSEHSVMPDDAEINGNAILAYLRGLFGIALIMAIAIVLEKSNIKPIVKMLEYLGSATLTILGLHIAGIIVFKVIYVKMGYPKETIPMMLAIPVSILISIIGAYIHHNVLARKFPIMIGKGHLLEKRKRNKDSQA